MGDPSEFVDILHRIASRIGPDMSEKDVENAFLNEGFYESLGYKGAGHDLRSEWSLPDKSRPDYVTLDDNESVTVVYEFKTSERKLSPHKSQLIGYVDELKADYGVLTNGSDFKLYQRGTEQFEFEVELEKVENEDARKLVSALEKPVWDITDAESVDEYISTLDPMQLSSDLGQEHFYNTYRLEEGSPFSDLVSASLDLLSELRDDKEEQFVQGAYDFWDASYSSAPDESEIPDSWDHILDTHDVSINDFMFCLETGHALLGRLLLAKSSDDYDFFPRNEWIKQYFRELPGFTKEINLDAYPIMVAGLMEDMRTHLVESLFEDDIFSWWTEGYQEGIARQHSSATSRFRDIAIEEKAVTEITEPTRKRFSNAVAHVLFSSLKFDFSEIEGDLLGDLYQEYFDPKTRKALGEFYTPEDVVDYILDSSDYEKGIYKDRLIDPACGSGTFLVEAVNRYIQDIEEFESGEPDWQRHLSALCHRPRIVGLDVHPFAVLMAQIRFMVAILPKYKLAKQSEIGDEFTINRLPIFRTDTLVKEVDSETADLGADEDRQVTLSTVEGNDDVFVPIPLPLRNGEGDAEFHYETIRLPLYDNIRVNTGVSNYEDYFATLQGILDVVKYHISDDIWKYGGGINSGVNRYAREGFGDIEEFMEPYVDDLLEVVYRLQEEHDDGRLFKMFEDSILSLVLKNYVDYDYVVGNPPWGGILLGSRGALSEESMRDRLREDYMSAYGRFDIYVPFIEFGIDRLGPGGTLGYITQNRFMNRNYGKKIREKILDDTVIDRIVDFGDYDEMFDATNYPCIIVTNEGTDLDNEFEFIDFGDEVHDYTVSEVMNNIRTREPDWVQQHQLPQSKLTADTWSPAKVLASDIVEKVKKGDARQTGDLYNTSQGCTIGGDGGEDIYVLSKSKAEELELEDELVRDVLKGGDIEKWAEPNEGRVLIYPYTDSGNPVNLDNYENIRDYLEEHKPMLESRHLDGKEITDWNKEWFELWRPRDIDVLKSQKLVTPRLETSNTFAVDAKGTFLLDSAVGVMVPEDHQKFLLGFFNSKWSQLFVNSESTYVQNRYWNYSQTVLEALPIIPPSQAEGTDSYEKISAAVEELIDLREIRQGIDDYPLSYIKDEENVRWIDYTWQTNRSSVEPSIEDRDGGLYSVDAGNTDSITDPLIDSEIKAEFVKEAVEGLSVQSGEEIVIPIPREDGRIQSILSKLEEDRNDVTNKRISELEEEIDKHVFTLLGLEEQDIDTVETCLEMF